jgi:hypothetical protein
MKVDFKKGKTMKLKLLGITFLLTTTIYAADSESDYVSDHMEEYEYPSQAERRRQEIRNNKLLMDFVKREPNKPKAPAKVTNAIYPDRPNTKAAPVRKVKTLQQCYQTVSAPAENKEFKSPMPGNLKSRFTREDIAKYLLEKRSEEKAKAEDPISLDRNVENFGKSLIPSVTDLRRNNPGGDAASPDYSSSEDSELEV